MGSVCVCVCVLTLWVGEAEGTRCMGGWCVFVSGLVCKGRQGWMRQARCVWGGRRLGGEEGGGTSHPPHSVCDSSPLNPNSLNPGHTHTHTLPMHTPMHTPPRSKVSKLAGAYSELTAGGCAWSLMDAVARETYARLQVCVCGRGVEVVVEPKGEGELAA